MTAVNQDTVTDHWNVRADSYNFNISRDLFQNDVDRRWKDLLAESLGDNGPLNILDAGCGPAVLTRLMLDLGHTVTGVDVSEKMIDHARKVVGDRCERVSFQQGSADELPFEDECFDLVISRYVVWTLPDPVKALTEWRRLLKPGGRIGIIDGNWYYHYFRSPVKRLWADANNLLHKMRSNYSSGQKLATHYAHKLPSTHVLRPDWDQGLLAGLGFRDIRVLRDVDERIYGRWSAERLKSPWTSRFFVIAAK